MYIPCEKIIPKMTPNIEIEIISSTLDAAITSVAMLLVSPKPWACKFCNVGTTTAGLTALKMEL